MSYLMSMTESNMRELKFRAWDKENKTMVGGFHCLSPRMSMFITQYAINHKQYKLMQYTGLKDKNGVEIYEGDVVADNPRKTFIQCHGEYDSAEVVKMKDIDGSDDMGTDCIGYPYYWEDFEVIGNIYENPELLTNNPTNDN